MGSKEITVSTEELADCNGNIETLCEIWSGVRPVISTADHMFFGCSKGESAECASGVAQMTRQVKEVFSKLLESTAGTFTAMGVSFEEADSAAAENIDALTN